MCNAYANKIPPDAIKGGFAQLRIPLVFPEGLPNVEPRDDIRITDRAPIVRAAGGGSAELVTLRWSWRARPASRCSTIDWKGGGSIRGAA